MKITKFFFVWWLAAASLFLSVQAQYVQSLDLKLAANERLLVSWNACNFGASKTPQTIDAMAQLMRFADLVVLQEVSTGPAGAQAVAKLADALNRLGAKWDYSVSPSTLEGSGKERYAYLWKTSRLQVKQRQISLVSPLANYMIREPGRMIFTVNGLEFAWYTFHLAPTAKGPEKEANMVAGMANVFTEQRLVLAGDFNLGADKLAPTWEKPFKCRHQIEGKTSLGNKIKADGSYFSKAYDNIFVRGMTVRTSGILNYFARFNDLKAMKAVSDHLPVFVVIAF
ncbi:MAG: endonuclease/exonuclease/phosphatase family protein [Candidatus Falkowbacteria bacterium]